MPLGEAGDKINFERLPVSYEKLQLRKFEKPYDKRLKLIAKLAKVLLKNPPLGNIFL
jgi:hypothetical protein